MSKLHLTYGEMGDLVKCLVDDIQTHFHALSPLRVYPVPRGGVPVALAIGALIPITLTEDAATCDIIVDDLIDSGATRDRLTRVGAVGQGKPFFALIDKPALAPDHWLNTWIVFPWETTIEGNDESATDIVVRLLERIGEEPTRGGLLETPKRVLKAWDEWAAGYAMDPADILKTFEDGATDEMVVERGIPFFSHCEHHMAPFFGTVDIGYVPNGKIVGLSKMNRLVECFARRLQVQERLTGQIADAMMEHLDAKGVGVVVKAQHMCVMSRGIRHAGCDTVTSAMRGVFMEGIPRAEFMALTR